MSHLCNTIIIGLTFPDNNVRVSTRPTPKTVITLRTVVDSNGNPLHVGNPVHVTRSSNTSVNSMSHLHHIRGSTSTNNAINFSQIARQVIVGNNGNPNSDHLANTFDVTGVNNISVTSIPRSTRSRRTAFANNATDSNVSNVRILGLWRRCTPMSALRSNVVMLVRDLITMLNQNNPLVQAFRMARERLSAASLQPVTLRLISTRQRNARQYNLPTASEVAALVPGDGNPTDSRDVIVEERGGEEVIEGQNNRPSSGPRTSYASIVQRENEIEEYLSCRYISASESCWKIYGFEMHYRSIAVERLPFHEEGCNRVYFREDDDAEDVVDRTTSVMSKFTGWMKSNIIYPEGRGLTYSDYPTMFTWHDNDKEWRPRKSGMAIGRIYYVTPSMGEKYYLRMLLNVVRGCRDWEELRTVDDIVYPTYRETCKAYRLLGDDVEWVQAVTNASQWQLGDQLRDMFVTILLFCTVSDHAQLFRECLPFLSEDIPYRQHQLLQNDQVVFTNEEIQNYTLMEIEMILNSNNRSLTDFPGLPQINHNLLNMGTNRLIAEERRYNPRDELDRFTNFELRANVTDNWTINVMVSRVWTTYNPKNNQVISLDIIIVDERPNSIHVKVPAKLMNKYKSLIVEGRVHNIHRFMVREYKMLYRPLDHKIFLEFCTATSVRPSSLPLELFDRYVFEFIPFNMLGSRAGNDTYLTDVIGVLREWGPFGENEGETKSAHPQIRKIVVCDTRDLKLRISLWGKLALKYTDDMIRSQKDTNIIVILTSCKVRRYGGKLFHEEINCVLFNNTANELLGHTVEELLTKSIKEGAGVPYWLDDFFVDKLLGGCVVLRIKIDKYNLAPTFVRRYTATKYYGDSVDILKENSGMMLPSKVDSVNLKITDEDEKIMDEIQWGSASDCSASKSATPTIPKTTIKVPLSIVNEARDANVELSANGSKNVLECEMNTTIIDTCEGSAANATMTYEDNLNDTHKDNETSHVHNDAVYVPAKLMNKYKSLIVEGRVHNIHRFMVREYKMLYRPLDRKIFLEFCTVTSVRPSSLPLELFDRYVFEFIPFNMLGSRAGNDTYLTDVIGVLREWGPLGENEGETKSAHPQIRKIVVCDKRDLKLRISLWGKLALKYTDDMIRSQKDTNIIVILTSCKVRRYGGGLQMTTTVATHFYLNLPIANCYAYNQRPIQPVNFPSNVPKSNVLTTEEINITTIPEFYERLANGVNVGAGVPYWLDDFFVDRLLGRCVVLRIKIDKYNLAPTFVRRYTATKYYGDSVDILKENSGMMLPSKVDSVNLKITDEDEKIMDEIQWGSASDCSASKSTTPTIPKTTIKVPLSTVNEARDANVELSANGSKNVLECEMNTTIIDTSEGSAANATMTNEDNLNDTHKDNETSHVHNDAVYVSIEDFKESDKKESDMKVDMKEGDMTKVVQDADMNEEDTKEDFVKKDDMKEGEI
ncbi:hypothetical protein CTI12_AA084870 [Artemisia annua]|uniref:Uncharacterized protein n=1 Tax=Artemisia annua TaxID=35608 RepID=A0A2U1Q1W7_ARTAN|nr:hypothetical protein CTI12_AA084870 [Artemisia annua]